ncbi:unnamed protein product [Prunus brigantina]
MKDNKLVRRSYSGPHLLSGSTRLLFHRRKRVWSWFLHVNFFIASTTIGNC